MGGKGGQAKIACVLTGGDEGETARSEDVSSEKVEFG